MQPSSPSGLRTAPYLAWGSHLAHAYATGDELRDVLVPFFQAGLENNERCLWVVREPLDADAARHALRGAVPDLDERERAGQIEIARADHWYGSGAALRPREMVARLLEREAEAVALGYAGLRVNGNCSWVGDGQWADFLEYEALVQDAVRERRLICLCSYGLDQLQDGAPLEVVHCHHLTIPSARPPGRMRSSPRPGGDDDRPQPPASDPDRLRQALERQKRTFDLAMAASRMGTWRYTIADNVCTYDENAQRLYGLSEPRFLHDEEGVATKFHPDDQPLLWRRVAEALDPRGDGRYELEYRVKQPDGSWRWLSAWGLVEFEGEGSERRAVAITGASRDLSDAKAALELQRLLLDELNHRIRNTLAIVQAVGTQTLKGAADLSSARVALERRIGAMAKAHDLLQSRAWEGADLRDVVARALAPFELSRITVEGPSLAMSPRQVLALSMALHELATNATKYGALSRAEGRVTVTWQIDNGSLAFSWLESGGPPVTPPTRKGFGSRLLERLLVSDLGGKIELHYPPSGVQFRIVTSV